MEHELALSCSLVPGQFRTSSSCFQMLICDSCSSLSHADNICQLFCMVWWSTSFGFVIPASAQQGEVESGTRRKVKRLLSFQRYCHASRLLRGLVPHTPGSLHLLDDDYLGQAAVRTLDADAQGSCVPIFLCRLCISCESQIGSENSLSFVTAHAIKSWHLELWHFPLWPSYKW